MMTVSFPLFLIVNRFFSPFLVLEFYISKRGGDRERDRQRQRQRQREIYKRE